MAYMLTAVATEHHIAVGAGVRCYVKIPDNVTAQNPH